VRYFLAPASGGDGVQGLYDALRSTTPGQSDRFNQLAPVIRRTFDIASMTRLSVGPYWADILTGTTTTARSFRNY
jgi:hypothetical protein